MLRVGHEVRYAITAQAVAYGIQWALAALVFSLWWGRSLAQRRSLEHRQRRAASSCAWPCSAWPPDW